MIYRTLSAGLVLAIFITTAGPRVLAADEPGAMEVTPHAAWRFGGSFDTAEDQELDLEDGTGFGLSVNFRAQSNTQWEIYYGRQSSEFSADGASLGDRSVDVDIDYLHGGGTYILDGESIRPYVVMTIGASRFSPEASPDLDDETFFSLSLGGGMRIAAGERVAFRLEGRFFTSFVETDSSLFCEIGGSTNLCLLRADSSTVTQWQVSAGLTLKF